MLQEEIERKTIAIAVKAGKFSAQLLAKVLAAAGRKITKELQKARVPQGRQSVKKLMNHSVSTNSIPLSGETRLFDRVARKWNVDYAFYKTEPGKYLLFFKAGQADAITACFSDYTKRMMAREREKRPSILQAIKRYAKDIQLIPRDQERQRETVGHER